MTEETKKKIRIKAIHAYDDVWQSYGIERSDETSLVIDETDGDNRYKRILDVPCTPYEDWIDKGLENPDDGDEFHAKAKKITRTVHLWCSVLDEDGSENGDMSCWIGSFTVVFERDAKTGKWIEVEAC